MTNQQICGGLLLFLFASVATLADQPHTDHSFQRIHLTDQFYGEGATAADINRDGAPDLISGPYWYAGPKFTERHEFYPPQPFDIAGYSDNFFAFAHDVNNDQWTDIVVVGFPGKEAWWYENPQGRPGHWKRHLALASVDNESPTLTDLTGDGHPELVCLNGGRFGYAEINRNDPTQPWRFQAISPNVGYGRFQHGLGVGDVNGDGRADLLEKNGWWEQPAQAEASDVWTFHPFTFSEPGGAQMFAYDVDGDGDNDVITSKAAHAYGLSWFENVPDGDAVTFHEHMIMGDTPEQNKYGVAFSQLHALALADIDHDGVQDIVTGKRYWAHGGHDVGGHAPAVLYWFRTVRQEGEDTDGEQANVHFIPRRIDTNSGVGTQVVVGDLNGDELPDVIVGNKKGTFAFVHHVDERAHGRAPQAK